MKNKDSLMQEISEIELLQGDVKKEDQVLLTHSNEGVQTVCAYLQSTTQSSHKHLYTKSVYNLDLSQI